VYPHRFPNPCRSLTPPLKGGGLDVSQAKDLLKDKIWTHKVILGPVEAVSPEEIDAEFDKLNDHTSSPADEDRLPPTVPINQVYGLSTLDDIQPGKATTVIVDDKLELGSQAQTMDSWDPASLLGSLGV